MRIVYFIDHLRPDGTQMFLTRLAAELANRGHYQAVVSLNSTVDSIVRQRLEVAGVDVRVVGYSKIFAGFGLAPLFAWMRHRRFDVAVTLLFAADALGRPLARAANIPRVVTSLRARNVDYAHWQHAVTRLTMGWADAVVINSRGVHDFALAVEGASASQLVYIPNGVDVREYHRLQDVEAVRAEFGLVRGRRLIGAAGRLTHQKGFDLLLEALALVPRDDVDLLLMGAGEEEASLRSQAVRLGLAKRVCFGGHDRTLPRLLGVLDLFVHPARFEGMPNVVLEAMATGCPIVATAVDGNCDLLLDERHGWLVPPGDPRALATAVGEALADPDEAQRRGEQARRRIIHEYSIIAAADAWEKVLGATQ